MVRLHTILKSQVNWACFKYTLFDVFNWNPFISLSRLKSQKEMENAQISRNFFLEGRPVPWIHLSKMISNEMLLSESDFFFFGNLFMDDQHLIYSKGIEMESVVYHLSCLSFLRIMSKFFLIFLTDFQLLSIKQ